MSAPVCEGQFSLRCRGGATAQIRMQLWVHADVRRADGFVEKQERGAAMGRQMSAAPATGLSRVFVRGGVENISARNLRPQ